MRIPSYHQDDAGRDNAAMTPLIDCVFLLLIFFVCASAGQLRELLLPTNLQAGAIAAPEAVDPPKPLGRAWIRLRRSGAEGTVVEVEGRTFAGDGLFDRLAPFLAELAEASEKQLPVILDAGPQVPLGDLIRAFDACRAAGFESIHFATDPSATPVKSTAPKS